MTDYTLTEEQAAALSAWANDTRNYGPLFDEARGVAESVLVATNAQGPTPTKLHDLPNRWREGANAISDTRPDDGIAMSSWCRCMRDRAKELEGVLATTPDPADVVPLLRACASSLEQYYASRTIVNAYEALPDEWKALAEPTS